MQINVVFGRCFYALTVPLTIFSVLMAISLDKFVTLTTPLILYAPIVLFAIMIFLMRIFVPYVRSANY